MKTNVQLIQTLKETIKHFNRQQNCDTCNHQGEGIICNRCFYKGKEYYSYKHHSDLLAIINLIDENK